MTAGDEVAALTEQLRCLAAEADTTVEEKYALRPLPGHQLTLYSRFRRAVGRVLRRIGLRRAVPLEPWVTRLRRRSTTEDARPVLIWALGIDRDELRAACEALRDRFQPRRDFAPVLVTDVADFTFFSRLGWLTEYVPTWSQTYAQRKKCYLAWRYRTAVAVPASVGLRQDFRIEDLRLG